jgi:Trypsin-like peptidase domain
VVRVQGVAPSCQRSIEGSSFVILRNHAMTNAHVVAEVTQHQTITTASGQTLPAIVVFYDPQVDVAVIYVPGLNLFCSGSLTRPTLVPIRSILAPLAAQRLAALVCALSQCGQNLPSRPRRFRVWSLVTYNCGQD